MNKEQFIEKIKEIKIKTPDELFFLEYNKVVCDILEENQELEKQFEAVKEVAIMHLKNEIQFKAQQKKFIECLEKEIVDSRAGSSQYYYTIQHLKLFKKIIGSDN